MVIDIIMSEEKIIRITNKRTEKKKFKGGNMGLMLLRERE